VLEKKFLRPDTMWKRAVNGRLLYSPVVVARGDDHTHIYIAGQAARDPRTGAMVGVGDMRAQLRRTCENIRTGLEHVGATFGDVTRAVTYTLDLEEYRRCVPVRSEYFAPEPPDGALVRVGRLALPGMLVEIEVEAVIEPAPGSRGRLRQGRADLNPTRSPGVGRPLPVAIACGADHARLYLRAGPAAPDGSIPAGMRAQLDRLCRNAQESLAAAGAGLADVVRHAIYTLDIDEYIRSVDVRFGYFSPDPPTDALLQVSGLATPGALVEMELEAVIEPERLRGATTQAR
jgi:enamine deaminase RidA (YjgF/YER057c/UK114 family)